MDLRYETLLLLFHWKLFHILFVSHHYGKGLPNKILLVTIIFTRYGYQYSSMVNVLSTLNDLKSLTNQKFECYYRVRNLNQLSWNHKSHSNRSHPLFIHWCRSNGFCYVWKVLISTSVVYLRPLFKILEK